MPRVKEAKYKTIDGLPHFSLRGAARVLKRSRESIRKDLDRLGIYPPLRLGQGKTIWLGPDEMVELKAMEYLRESFGKRSIRALKTSPIVVADCRHRAAEWFKTLIHAIETGEIKLGR